jgi:hypothetical protein
VIYDSGVGVVILNGCVGRMENNGGGYDAKSIFELNICVTRCISIAYKGPIGYDP